MPGSAMKKRPRPEEDTQATKKKVDFQGGKQAVAHSFSVTKLRKPQVSPPVVGEALSNDPTFSRKENTKKADAKYSPHARNLSFRLLSLQCIRKRRTTGCQAAKGQQPASACRDGIALLGAQDGRLHGSGGEVEECGYSPKPLPCRH